MFLIALLLVCISFVPLRLKIRMSITDHIRSEFAISAPLLRHSWQLQLVRMDGVLQFILIDGKRPRRSLNPSELSGIRNLQMFHHLRALKQTQRFFVRRLNLEKLCVVCHVHLDNAAHTALLTGAIRSLLPCLPTTWQKRTSVFIQPSFHQPFALSLSCIARVQTGMLLITTAMALGELLLQASRRAREAIATWNIPSES